MDGFGQSCPGSDCKKLQLGGERVSGWGKCIKGNIFNLAGLSDDHL